MTAMMKIVMMLLLGMIIYFAYSVVMTGEPCGVGD